METQSWRSPGGCLAKLQAALGEDALQEFQRDGELSAAARHAAYGVAVARGYCRLLQVDLGDLQETLPARLAAVACGTVGEQLAVWTDDAVQLTQRWDAARGRSERTRLCVTLLENRMDAWAAFVELDEAAGDPATGAGPESRDLEPALDDLAQRLAAFDDALSEQEDILSTICGLPLLDDWRAMLGDSPYVEHGLPWWLDGSLEAAAAWIDVDGARGPWILPRIRSPDVAQAAGFGKSWVLSQIQLAPAVGLASEPRPETRTGILAIVWRSPDRKFLAQLTFPRVVDLHSRLDLKLSLVWAEPMGEPAPGQFQKVQLSGMREIPLEPGASVVLLDAREFFDSADEHPRLLIDDQEWSLAEMIGGDS